MKGSSAAVVVHSTEVILPTDPSSATAAVVNVHSNRRTPVTRVKSPNIVDTYSNLRTSTLAFHKPLMPLLMIWIAYRARIAP